jgi:arginyl-tRNA synthetase
MLSIEIFLKTLLKEILSHLCAEGILPKNTPLKTFSVEKTKKNLHGEISTNAALVFAKEAGLSPSALALLLSKHLCERVEVKDAKTAGPGFINIQLTKDFWLQHARHLLKSGDDYGCNTCSDKSPVNVEYVSANPTGPLHGGHGRVAVVADVIANLLAFVGVPVVREYYINDKGTQVDLLAKSVYVRYCKVAGKKLAALPEGCYPGEYLQKPAELLFERDGAKWADASEQEWLPAFKTFSIQYFMGEIKKTLARLKIGHDVFTSEADLYQQGVVQKAIQTLEEKKFASLDKVEKAVDSYHSKISPPAAEGPLLMFKSSCFGDEKDRPLKKSSGEWTYFAGDIGYHADKLSRGFKQMINVWGADHAGHETRLLAAMEALTGEKIPLEIILCQIVHFVKDGQPFKMSKRFGTFITVDDLLDELGVDVFRMLMVERKHDTQFTLDIDQALKASLSNPVFYIHYAYARASSVLRAAKELFSEEELDEQRFSQADLSLLSTKEEQALLKSLVFWPDTVLKAAIAREPHRIVSYLYNVSAEFHGLWAAGTKNPLMRFLTPENLSLSYARLALLESLRVVLRLGFGILGISPREKMA